jgi:ATP-binding cassette subfamily B protein
VIVGYGGWLSSRGVVEVGVVAAFVLYLQQVFEPINQLSQLYNVVQSAGAALQKILGVLDTRASIVERRGAVDLPRGGEIDVDDVTFAYGSNDPVLHDVTLHIAPGERIALVGPTGAGKSTLAKLIARFYDPVEGAVRADGLICATRRSAHCASAVVVPQEGFPSVVRAERAPAVRKRPTPRSDRSNRLDERTFAPPEGLDTEVRERGSRLSAGERQLISPPGPRRRPSVLVLDERPEPRPRHRAPGRTAMEERTHGAPRSRSHRCRPPHADRIGVVRDSLPVRPHAGFVAGGHYAGCTERPCTRRSPRLPTPTP